MGYQGHGVETARDRQGRPRRLGRLRRGQRCQLGLFQAQILFRQFGQHPFGLQRGQRLVHARRQIGADGQGNGELLLVQAAADDGQRGVVAGNHLQR